MEVSPKVKHFLWRLCIYTLPICGLLKHRHMIDDDLCPRDYGELETQEHAVFGCTFLRDCWVDSGCDDLRGLALAAQ